MAIISSKEVAEKKRELMTALAKVASDKQAIERLRGREKGPSHEGPAVEADRQYKADLAAVEGIERTLHSWQISEEEIAVVREASGRVRPVAAGGELKVDSSWGDVRVLAPFDGVVLERQCQGGGQRGDAVGFVQSGRRQHFGGAG